MLNAKISPSQVYWLPKVLLKYKNLGWLDVDIRLVSYSDAIIYERPDIRIHFEKDNQFMNIYIDHLGREKFMNQGDLNV
jgi:hypothetical protein